MFFSGLWYGILRLRVQLALGRFFKINHLDFRLGIQVFHKNNDAVVVSSMSGSRLLSVYFDINHFWIWPSVRTFKSHPVYYMMTITTNCMSLIHLQSKLQIGCHSRSYLQRHTSGHGGIRANAVEHAIINYIFINLLTLFTSIQLRWSTDRPRHCQVPEFDSRVGQSAIEFSHGIS